MLQATDFFYDHPKQIVILLPKQELSKGQTRRELEALKAVLRALYLPNRVMIVAKEGRDLREKIKWFALLRGKKARARRVTAYVCVRQTCKQPTTQPAIFRKQLMERHVFDFEK